MQTLTIKLVTFEIPDDPAFPDGYRGGMVEIGVWPPPGVMPSVLEREGGMEALKQYAIYNILQGFVEGAYTETEIREQQILIRAWDGNDELIIDTLDRRFTYIP